MTASARGLFRATGKTAKPAAVRDMHGEIVKVAQLEREASDFYPTPPEPTRALLRAERERLADFPAIWEPAAGDGAMAREIEAVGHQVVRSDLIDRGGDAILRDFFDFTEAPAPAMITNPPYHLVNCRDGKGRWVTHAMEALGVDYMALLLSWNWPGAGGLGALWSDWPPARVYLMRWKIDFTGAGAPPMLNGWFVWDCAWRGEPALRMLDRDDDARQERLL